MLAKHLEAFIANHGTLDGALTGVSIRLASSGELWYGHHHQTRFRPASNMKLLTAAAALEKLGEDYRFSTEVWVNGTVENNSLDGDLYVKGKGDPTLLPQDLSSIVESIQEQGIHSITGNLYVDDTWYDDVRLSPDLTWSDETFYYGAQISAFTISPTTDFDTGSVCIEIVPGKAPGELTSMIIQPETNYVEIVNQVITAGPGGEADIISERVHGGNVVYINGTIPADSEPAKEWIAVWDPTLYAFDFFKQAWKRADIHWTGQGQSAQVPSTARLIYTNKSMPLSKILIPFMKLSNNGIGDILVKEMGRQFLGEGSWDKGLEVVHEALTDIGVPTESIIIRDGSGISHATSISPDFLSMLLYQVQDKPWYDVFLHSLPVAGHKDRMTAGTLQERMEKLDVKAKTGTIFGVSTLSGYLRTKSNQAIIFSLMLNYLMDEEAGPDVLDEMVQIISEHEFEQ